MNVPQRHSRVLAAVAFCCLSTLSNTNANAADATIEPSPAKSKSNPSISAQNAAKDEANSSPRERGRILVKRNPIASEYQIFGDIGTSPGADSDGEGVDFRAYFPQANPADIAARSLRLGYAINYNDQSSIGRGGYSVQATESFGQDSRWGLAAQYRTTESDRLIEHYESVWQENEDGSFLLDRPRLSFDRIFTRNTIGSAQLGYQPNDRNAFYFKTYRQDYFDNSYRNRLELQFGSADLIDGTETIAPDGSITSGSFQNARTRRYFGDTDNKRTRIHNTIGGSYKGEEWEVDYALYSQKWNLDTVWYNWNFRDQGLDLSYQVDDPYFPEFIEGEGVNMLDVSNADFSSLRIHNTHTRDRDLAARIDAERSLFSGESELWMQTGLLHREKERESWEDRSVHLPSDTQNFTLDEVAYDVASYPLLDGKYQLPAGLDPAAGKSLTQSNPELFPVDAYRSKVESAPQSYTAEESVTSAYLLASREFGKTTLELGGRIEHTKTSTRGTVVIPEAVNDPDEGVLIETVTNPQDGSISVIKDLYSSNSYSNFVPSAEVSYKASESSTFKAAWFQLLMRPQYFNIVDYRRVSVPTRSISEGNPNLSPTEIDKFRLSWTKENDLLGSFSIEGYLINVENFFYGSVSTEEILEDGVPAEYRVSRVENGESSKIKGFEIQWQKSIEELPLFDKAVASLAYTYSDSEAYVDTRPNDILSAPERSEHLLKASLSGTVGKLTSVLDLSYQSEALDDLGSSYDQDEYREAVVQLALRNRYALTDSLSLSLDLANLTDHPERSYEGSPIRVSRNQYSSWYGSVGISQTF